MSTVNLNFIFWEFCRITHADGSMREYLEPILRCEGAVPTRISIGAYQVSISDAGLVTHEWGERVHTDTLSAWQVGNTSGFEVSIYEEELHEKDVWRVGVWKNEAAEVFKLKVPQKPMIDKKKVMLRKTAQSKVVAVFSTFGVNEGGWEWVRQKINNQGVYAEVREKADGVDEKKEILIDADTIYDAILITKDGWEEKFILKGAMAEVKKCGFRSG